MRWCTAFLSFFLSYEGKEDLGHEKRESRRKKVEEESKDESLNGALLHPAMRPWKEEGKLRLYK